MTVHIVRLGSARLKHEGTRIGTVRRPPRGVRKSDYVRENWFDVWFPNLAPSVETMKLAHQARSAADWRRFKQKYRAEMSTPENGRTLDVLASLSQHSHFSVGCYCQDEAQCHRSVLREMLIEKGAKVA